MKTPKAINLFKQARQIISVVTVFCLPLLASGVHAWTGKIPIAFDINPDPDIFETTLVASRTDKEIKGPGTTLAQMYTFNGISPGPEIRVKAGDRIILHVFNNLPVGEDIVIHSHGVELSNSMDGTQVTQDNIPSGGSFVYDYIAPRAGTFWYHSHASTSDRTFKGLYGPLIVTEPAEDILRAEGVLPSDDNTYTLILSDTTMCEDVSFTSPNMIQAACFGQEPGFVPPIQPVFNCRTAPLECLVREGTTVLSNGRMVQAGDVLDVTANQPVRFRIINTSTVRYFRLVQPVSGPLLRIGGEGGLLNNVVVDPVMLPAPGLATTGDILLAPAERADIIITPQPGDVGNVITILSDLPPPGNYNSGKSTNKMLSAVPVLQLNVLAAQTPDSSLSVSDPLLTHPAVNKLLEDFSEIPAADLGQLLNPASFGLPGSENSLITLNIGGTDISGDKGPAIDGVRGRFMNANGFESIPHIASSRFGVLGDVLELSVTNTTGADHPFHFHGNSFQVTNIYDGTKNYSVPVEFIDTVNVPKNHVVTFRVRLEDRPQIIDNNFEPYGGLGRWLFHCHITTHAELGMISELSVVAPPAAFCQDINVTTETEEDPVQASIDNGSFDPDGDTFTLEQVPTGPYFLGETSVTLTVADSMGLASRCQGTVSVSIADDDNDGVNNKNDFCPDTLVPETAPTSGLGVNRFVLLNQNSSFDTVFPGGNGKGPGKAFDLDQTSGCSCEQIIDLLDLGMGHVRHGCSIGAMEQWIGVSN